ncbi:MAG: hypothetical protein ACYDHY_07685 [Acidiferrobacterales bacterium]
MAKEGRELVKEAVADAQSLKEAALSAAKAQLVEGMAPAIKLLLEKEIKSALNEKRGLTGKIDSSQRADYMSDKLAKWEEGKEHKGDTSMAEKATKELDMEALNNFFPQMSEEPEHAAEGEKDPHSVAGNREVPDLGGDDHQNPPAEGEFGEGAEMAHSDGVPCEGVACKHADHHAEAGEGAVGGEGEKEMPEAKDVKKNKEDDEEVEISEAELKKVYEAALQTEVTVKKGFSDMTRTVDFVDQKPDGSGILPVVKGDKHWNEEEPPHVTKNVPEAVQRAIAAGLAENKQLRAKLTEMAKLCQRLGTQLHEVNLFNSKVLHVNKILNSGLRLTAEQKKVVLESMDKASNTGEVVHIYETIVKSFKSSKLAEGRVATPKANASGVRTTGTPKNEVLRESVDRAAGEGKYSRLLELSGLSNLKK